MNKEKSLTPKLRFPEFSGEWEEKKLGEVAKKMSLKNKDGKINLVLTNSATQGIVNQQDYFDKDIANQNNLGGYFIVNKDDFIYNPRISKYAPVGPIKRNHLEQGVMSPLYTVFKFYGENLEFLETYFKTTFWYKYMKGIANYGARHDRMNITNEGFFKMPIFFPSLQEQEKIAQFLSSVDSKVEKLEKKKELLEEYKKGMMQKIFSQEIRFSDENGNEYPQWEEKKLGEISDIKTGNKDTQNKVENGLYPFYVRSNTVEKIDSYSFEEEAILTAGDGVGVGKVFHYLKNQKFDYHQRVYNIHNFSENSYGKYIFHYFSTYFYKRVKRLSAKNSVDSVRKEMISKMIIPSPCLKEQKK